MVIDKSDNIIQDLTFNFAARIVKFYRHLTESKNVYVLSKQDNQSKESISQIILIL